MGEITGRQVLAVTCGGFGIIIAVNLLMAYKAVSTFPGLEVKNSYVASQSFERERTAQDALGWTVAHTYDPATHELRLVFAGADNLPVQVGDLTVLVGRATVAGDDLSPTFTRRAGAYVADVTLHPGKWMMQVQAQADDGTLFRQRLDLFVKG